MPHPCCCQPQQATASDPTMGSGSKPCALHLHPNPLAEGVRDVHIISSWCLAPTWGFALGLGDPIPAYESLLLAGGFMQCQRSKAPWPCMTYSGWSSPCPSFPSTCSPAMGMMRFEGQIKCRGPPKCTLEQTCPNNPGRISPRLHNRVRPQPSPILPRRLRCGGRPLPHARH